MSAMYCPVCGGMTATNGEFTRWCTCKKYTADLQAAVDVRQAAPRMPQVRIVLPSHSLGDALTDYEDRVVAVIRAAGCVPVDAKGNEL